MHDKICESACRWNIHNHPCGLCLSKTRDQAERCSTLDVLLTFLHRGVKRKAKEKRHFWVLHYLCRFLSVHRRNKQQLLPCGLMSSSGGLQWNWVQRLEEEYCWKVLYALLTHKHEGFTAVIVFYAVICNKLNSQAIHKLQGKSDRDHLNCGCEQHKLSSSCFWTVVNRYLCWGIQMCHHGSSKVSSWPATASQTTAWRTAYCQPSGPPMKRAISGHTSFQFSFFHTILWRCLVGKGPPKVMRPSSIHCGPTLSGCSAC